MSFPTKVSLIRKQRAGGGQGRRRSPTLLNLESLEPRWVPTDFRSITGLGNNPVFPHLGQAHTDLIRIAPAAYADGISAPSGANRPSARYLSNALSDQTDPNNPSQDLETVNAKRLTDFIYVFGQFLDHDIDLTTGGTGSQAVRFDIPADQPDDPFNPPGFIPFTRSEFDRATGTSRDNPRQQLNDVTAFIDGSQVYGADDGRASLLRTHEGGHLKTSPGNLLPYNNATYFGASAPLPNANDAGIVPDGRLFVAGDIRANENIELTAMQTLFVREHNRVADRYHGQHPDWSDEQLYQMARRWVGAELQVITYTEWLPALLGANALPAYHGYNGLTNPGIANEFSTALFRFAHSQLDNTVDRLQDNGLDITADPAGAGVDLALAFFNPTLINPAGVYDPFSGHLSTDIDPILKASASGIAQEVDLPAVRDVRNLLFGPPGSGGSDLIARDIQRGRDHGLTDYNSMRAAYGLPRVSRFDQITSDVQYQQALQQEYGSVDNIDAFVGALAEDHALGADVGPLTRAVLVNQFTRLRNGDRFFYLNQFSGDELTELQQTTSLAQVIARNTHVTNLQGNVFLFRSVVRGTAFLDLNRNGVRDSGEPGLPGLTLQLVDGGGDVLATATSDLFGNYAFNGFNGLTGTGEYGVQLVVPDGLLPTSENPLTVLISRGDVTMTGVNFGVTLVFAGSGLETALRAVPSGTGGAVLPQQDSGGAGPLASRQVVPDEAGLPDTAAARPVESATPPSAATTPAAAAAVDAPASDDAGLPAALEALFASL